MPTIAVVTLELHIEGARSLKDKRHFVKGLKDRLRKRCNVAVAEIDYQNLWQRSLVAAVTVASNRASAEQTMQAVEKEAISTVGPYLVDSTVEWIG